MKLLHLFLYFIALWSRGCLAAEKPRKEMYNLARKGQEVLVSAPESGSYELTVFCHSGANPSLTKFWSLAELRLNIHTDDYYVYMGPNTTAVKELCNAEQSSLFYTRLPWKPKNLKLSPFETTCVGILAQEEYKVVLQIWMVNFWQVSMTLVGLLLYFYAPSLCANVFLHYTTGVTIGICLSLILITYFVQKRFRFWLSFTMVFYSLSVYMLTTAWYNLKEYLIERHIYVLAYLVIVGSVSFAVTYRMGPIENPRTLNLIQWSLQLIALCLIYLSSYHQAASLSVVLIIVGWKSIPASIKTKMQVQYRRRFFKPKITLLSESEYLDQSRVETERALQDLRQFCRSPKCDSWKITTRLSTPSRFAEFVEGASHLTQEEVMNYSQVDDDSSSDNEHHGGPAITDDDSSDDTGVIDLLESE